MVELVVYSRRGCHLCELLLEELYPLCRGRATIRVEDIDTNPEWAERFGLRVPVIWHDGRAVCEARLDRQAVLALLDGGADA